MVEMVALGALEVENYLYDPSANILVPFPGSESYIIPEGMTKFTYADWGQTERVVIQSLQFYLSWRLHYQIQLEGDSTRKYTWLS